MEAGWKKEFDKLLSSLKDAKEAEELLTILLTPAEYEDVIKRWQIIRLLFENKPQRLVRDKLQTAIATVSHGAREVKSKRDNIKKFYQRLY